MLKTTCSVRLQLSKHLFFQARSVNVKSQVGSAYQNISSLEITGTPLTNLFICLFYLILLFSLKNKYN